MKPTFIFRYIQGARITGGASSPPNENTSGDTNSYGEESLPNNGNSKYVPAGPSLRARFVGQGYKQVHENIFLFGPIFALSNLIVAVWHGVYQYQIEICA